MTPLNAIASTVDVTRGHLCDSRASRVPTPTPTPTKTVQQREALDLGEEPEKGPAPSAEPDAPRLDGEPRAHERGPFSFSDSEFRRLCVLVRSELTAHPGLDGPDLMEQLKCACAAARLRYNAQVLGRVLDVVQPRRRASAARPEPPRVHWRDRCPHTPRCETPTRCELLTMRGGR